MDIVELNEYLLSPVAQVAIIMGVAEVIKRMGLDKKYIPLIDLALGIISGIIVYGLIMSYGVLSGAMVGVSLGLSACGMFSSVKNLTEKEYG